MYIYVHICIYIRIYVFTYMYVYIYSSSLYIIILVGRTPVDREVVYTHMSDVQEAGGLEAANTNPPQPLMVMNIYTCIYI